MRLDDGTPSTATTRKHLIVGETQISADADVEISTVLGSCVAACLFDPVSRIGGMNHFLLSGDNVQVRERRSDEDHTAHPMEALLREMIAQGASKYRLRAHIYGGACFHLGMEEIGASNVAFARSFLAAEHIALAHEDVGGCKARHVHFRPAQGKARCTSICVQSTTPQGAPLPCQVRAGGINPSQCREQCRR